ncbi:MAG: hypothetical protein O3A85_11610 [Proteobacteria bacterium]|nr:hypothetical protein [Pseudomonadota bacterium]
MSVVLLAVAISGLAAEFAVRLAQPELNPARHLRFEASQNGLPTLGPRNTEQRQIKNTGDFNVMIRFNRYGLRDSKDLATSTEEDIFLVGDSFTFGWGVKENERISEQLQTLSGRRVFNLSIPTGFNGYEKLLDYATANGARIKNVIIAVSMETDLGLYDKASAPKDAVPTPPSGAGNILKRIKGYLTDNSALYVLTTTLIHRTSALKALAVGTGFLTPNLEGVRKYEFSQQVIESSARRLQKIAVRFNTTVVVLPSRALWAGDHQTVEGRRHSTFVKRILDRGLDVIDLRAAFEAGGNPLIYHFANDPHWTPRGHALAAKVLAAHLKTKRKTP